MLAWLTSTCLLFTPTPDITTYELATILVHVESLKGRICFVNKEVFDNQPESIRRHFREDKK